MTCNNKNNVNNDKPVATYYIAPNLTLKQQHVDFQPLNFSVKILLYVTLTYSREKSTPVMDTAPPAGPIQDHITLVSCPAPCHKNTPGFTGRWHQHQQLVLPETSCSSQTLQLIKILLSQSPCSFLFFSSSTTNLTDKLKWSTNVKK